MDSRLLSGEGGARLPDRVSRQRSQTRCDLSLARVIALHLLSSTNDSSTLLSLTLDGRLDFLAAHISRVEKTLVTFHCLVSDGAMTARTDSCDLTRPFLISLLLNLTGAL